jgi:hypothetical protein
MRMQGMDSAIPTEGQQKCLADFGCRGTRFDSLATLARLRLSYLEWWWLTTVQKLMKTSGYSLLTCLETTTRVQGGRESRKIERTHRCPLLRWVDSYKTVASNHPMYTCFLRTTNVPLPPACACPDRSAYPPGCSYSSAWMDALYPTLSPSA